MAFSQQGGDAARLRLETRREVARLDREIVRLKSADRPYRLDVRVLSAASVTDQLSYMPWRGTSPSLTIGSYAVQFITPYAGRVMAVQLRSASNAAATTVGLHIDRATTPVTSTTVSLAATTVTQFTLAYPFGAGREIAISVDGTNAPGDTVAVVVLEYVPDA